MATRLESKFEAQRQAIQLFLHHGCSPFDVDKAGFLPVQVALANHQNVTDIVKSLIQEGENRLDSLHVSTKNYGVIDDLLDAMIEHGGMMPSPGIFSTLVQNINLCQIDKEASALEKIALTLPKRSVPQSQEWTSIVEHSNPKSKLTPVIELCRQYAKFPKNNFNFEPTGASECYLSLAGMKIENGLLTGYEARLKAARDMIMTFIETFEPSLQQTFEVEVKRGVKKTANTSALLEIVQARDGAAGFEMVWALDPNPVQSLNLTDENGLSGLMRAVKRGDFDQAVFLVSKGAEINNVVKEQNPADQDGFRANTVVIQAIKGGSLKVRRMGFKYSS